MKHDSPKIETRTFEQLLQQARSMAPFYTPEWEAMHEVGPGVAVLKIYLRMFEQIAGRLNRAPDKNLVAFLDMLGIDLQPAQSARGYVTFTTAEGTPVDVNVLVPKGTELVGTGKNAEGEDQEVLFQTEHDLRVSPARLKEVVSVDANNDRLYKHSKEFTEGESFTLFRGKDQQEHSLYLAHEDLFNQTAPARIVVDFVVTSPAAEDKKGLQFKWEYWDAEREDWATLAELDNNLDDTTRQFKRSGSMTLEKNFTAEIAATEVFGAKKNRWIRCRLTEPLSASTPQRLPAIDTVRLSVNPIDPFSPDLAFYNDIPIEVETVRIVMCGKDIDLEFGDPQDCPDPDQARLTISEGNFEAGDVIEFDNLVDAPERQTVKEAPEGDDVCVRFGETLDLTKYGPTTKVTLVTAVRAGEQNPTIQVRTQTCEEDLEGEEDEANTLKGLLITPGGKVLLGTTQPEEAYIEDGDDNSIELSGTITKRYLKGDTLQIVPLIKPFGEVPLVFDTFYITSDEAFSKKGAMITLEVKSEWHGCDKATPAECTSQGRELDPVLSWEYWNGQSWRGIRVNDTTNRFFDDGLITFTCPKDIKKVEVNGEEKFWIRVRLIDGDFGKEVELKPKNPNNQASRLEAKQGTIYYPVIKELKISYKDVQRFPQHCLTVNSLDHKDRSDDCINEDTVFEPFVAFDETLPGLYLGFDKPLTSGPLRLLFDLTEQNLPADARLKMHWSFWNGKAWEQINVTDGTEGLTEIGSLEWVGSRDFESRELFDAPLYWMKGVLTTGKFPKPPEIKGLFLNTVEALQSALIQDEVLGSSDGTMNQTFALLNKPIIDQTVWVQERTQPTDEGRAQIIEDEGEDAVKTVPTEPGQDEEVWVRWHAVPDFDDSGPMSRHYTVDKRLGKIQFGDGREGMVPPSGVDNITSTYRFGGGVMGNVPPQSITGLKNAIPFIDAVTNHLAADGGAEAETLDAVLKRGPQRLKNRNRAVTVEDFEWIARNVKRKVARAKALPNHDRNGNTNPGWVTVLIVPDSKDVPPLPTNQLIDDVEAGLKERMANTISTSAPKYLHVRAPDYVKVIVKTTVVPVSLDAAARVEDAVRKTLNRFIHPLTGGPHETGWGFGEAICRSEIIATVEGAVEVDHVERLVFVVDGTRHKGDVPLNVDQLPFSGDHVIDLNLPGANGTTQRSREASECADTN